MSESDHHDVRELEDEWIAVRCQLGERAAFDELVQRWHQPLWKYARRITGEDDAARDVAQEVWLRVFRGIGRLRDRAKLRSWLFGIARRVLMDRLRHQYATRVAAEFDATEIADEEPPTAVEEDLSAMHEELSALPATEREVLTLFYLRELTLAEIAEVLGVPVGTIKSRLFRARQLLRRALIQKGVRP